MSNTAAVKEATSIGRPLSLGEFIAVLEGLDAKNRCVFFDFGSFHPEGFMSYRGYYRHLALTYNKGGNVPTVGELLNDAKLCVGKDFEGYKGGLYHMDEKTHLWVANYGDADSCALTGVKDYDNFIILRTSYIHYSEYDG